MKGLMPGFMPGFVTITEEKLPDEVLKLVFVHLGVGELGSACQVCLQWNDVSLCCDLWQPFIEELFNHDELKRFKYDRSDSKKELFWRMNSSLVNQRRATSYLRSSFSLSRDDVAPQIAQHVLPHQHTLVRVRWRRKWLLLLAVFNSCWWFSLLVILASNISSSNECAKAASDGWMLILLVQDFLLLVSFLCLTCSIRFRTVAQLAVLSNVLAIFRTSNPIGRGLKTCIVCLAIGTVTSILQLASASSSDSRCEQHKMKAHNILILVGLALNFLYVHVAAQFQPQRQQAPVASASAAAGTAGYPAGSAPGNLDERFLM